MDVAFIEDTQHQIHQHQGAEDHQRLALGGLGEGIGGTAKLGDHFLRQAELGHRALHRGHGLVGAVAFGDVEGDGFGSELPFVADTVIGQTVLVAGETRQRHTRTVGGDHLDLFQGARVPSVLC